MMKKISGQTKFLLFFLLLVGAAAVFLTSESVKFKNEPKVPVTAVITAMEEYDHTAADNTDRGYSVYVDYDHDGKNYQHIMYKDVGLSTELRPGDTLKLEVYERNPDKIAQDATSFAVYLWLLFAAGVVFMGTRVKNDLEIAAKQAKTHASHF